MTGVEELVVGATELVVGAVETVVGAMEVVVDVAVLMVGAAEPVVEVSAAGLLQPANAKRMNSITRLNAIVTATAGLIII